MVRNVRERILYKTIYRLNRTKNSQGDGDGVEGEENCGFETE